MAWFTLEELTPDDGKLIVVNATGSRKYLAVRRNSGYWSYDHKQYIISSSIISWAYLSIPETASA